MATYIYSGLPGREPSPDGITLRGVHFPLGEPVEVSDPNFAAKLARMAEFQSKDPEPAPDVVPASVEPAPEAAPKRRGRPPKVKPVTDEEPA